MKNKLTSKMMEKGRKLQVIRCLAHIDNVFKPYLITYSSHFFNRVRVGLFVYTFAFCTGYNTSMGHYITFFPYFYPMYIIQTMKSLERKHRMFTVIH